MKIAEGNQSKDDNDCRDRKDSEVMCLRGVACPKAFDYSR